jgi:F0F1-type ATP synthase delta subunit
MKFEYAQAFLKSLKTGMAVNTAITGLKSALEKKHHSKLFGPVLLEVLRILEASKGSKQAVVTVANQVDLKTLKASIQNALKELGIEKDTSVKEVVDETLVGGFVATYDYKEHDASYKKSLKNLYESIVK